MTDMTPNHKRRDDGPDADVLARFEARLAVLRPAPPSAELADRIALADEPHRRHWLPDRLPWSTGLSLAAILVISVLAWIVLQSTVSDGPADPPPKLVAADGKLDPQLPTAGAYLRAMRESDEALDVLLQKHADTLMPPTPAISLTELIKDFSS